MTEFKVTSLDASEIKESLKQALRADATFTDYDYEGSGLSTLLDTLSRNSHYMAYLANMMSNESFIDTAQLRSTVVSHAKRLSYTPKSKTAATAVVSLTVNPFDKTSLPASIQLDKNRLFVAGMNESIVTFVTTDEYTLVKNGSNNFVASNIVLKQGELVTDSWTYSSGDAAIFEIPNKNIDTSTLRVTVYNSDSDLTATVFTQITDVTTIDGNSPVFFLHENNRGKFQIEFGEGVLGKALVDGNIVYIEYVAVTNEPVNGVKSISAASSIGGYTDVTITVTTPSYGGSERESIERIRHLAPKSYTAQNRAVTPSDYEVIVLRNNPNLKSAKAWGGEDNKPVRYGNVFVSVIDNSGEKLDTTALDAIRDDLKKYSMVGIRPIVNNAAILDLDVTVNVDFDATKTTKSRSAIGAEIAQLIDDYSANSLEAFNRDFVQAQLSKLILDAQPSVTQLEISVEMSLDLTTVPGSLNYISSFFNPIVEGSLSSDEYVNAAGQTVSLTDVGGKLYAGAKEVGKIDYVTGDFNFIDNVTNLTELNISVKPKNQNIKAKNTFIIKIGFSTVGAI